MSSSLVSIHDPLTGIVISLAARFSLEVWYDGSMAYEETPEAAFAQRIRMLEVKFREFEELLLRVRADVYDLTPECCDGGHHTAEH